MAAVSTLCSKTIVLTTGILQFIGSPVEGISYYLKNIDSIGVNKVIWDKESAPGDHRARLLRVEAKPVEVNGLIAIDKGVRLQFEIESRITNQALDVSFNVVNSENILMFHHGNLICQPENLVKGKYILSVMIPPYTLSSGEYTVDVWMGLQGLEMVGEKQNSIVTFYMEDAQIDHLNKKLAGVIKPLLRYETLVIKSNEL